MSSFISIKDRFKPYRYTINKGITIIDSSEGKYIVKKQSKELETLFNYLESRGFDNFPKIAYNYRNEENVYEFIEEDSIPKKQKIDELAKVVASLHNKTVYFKDISIDNIKEIKSIIEENITYMRVYYEGLFLKNCKYEFQSPSQYLLCRNYYRIMAALNYAKDNLDKWYENADKTEFRVSVIHNNLSLDHYIYNKYNSKLVSWDKYRIDSPIIDIANFYKKEYLNANLSSFFKEYFKRFEITNNERDLLFIMLSIPNTINIDNLNEIDKVREIKKLIKYIDDTENLIRPYNLNQKE